MLRSTFMFGKRLNCWKTIPIFLRTSRICFSGAGWSRSPATVIVPSSGLVRVISSRRIVVLPEPEGPIKVTCLPASTEKFSRSSTVFEPNRLVTPSRRISSPPPVDGPALVPGSFIRGVSADKASLQGSQEKGGQVGDDDEGHTDHGERLGELEVLLGVE